MLLLAAACIGSRTQPAQILQKAVAMRALRLNGRRRFSVSTRGSSVGCVLLAAVATPAAGYAPSNEGAAALPWNMARSSILMDAAAAL
jgi:hypothetical protein